MSDPDRPTVRWCAIAARAGSGDIACPPSGCRLLLELGEERPEARSAAGVCPVEEIARRAGFDPLVVRTLDDLRAELERLGPALSETLARRGREARHEATLRRWPEE